MSRSVRLSIAAILCTGSSFAAGANQSAEITPITIPPGHLSTALDTVAAQTQTQLLYDAREIAGVQTRGVSNARTLRQALDSLLEGTRLAMKTDASGATLIASASALGVSSTDEPKLDEVLVSARRREESEKDVPVSMVVKTGEALQRSHVEDLTQLERLVPGMVYQGLSISYYPAIYLRGIGTSSISSGVDPSVGVALDGVVSARTNALSGNFDDIERIEVLRGPQGTLFGKNSSAGLISLVTKDPTQTLTGSLRGGYGSYDEKKLSAAVSGPLFGSSDLRGRLSVYGDNRGGYLKNLTTGRNVIDEQQRGGRGSLLWEPLDGTELRLRAYFMDRHNNWGHSFMPIRYLGPLSTPGDVLQANIAGPENDAVVSSGDGGYPWYQKSAGETLQWDQKIGNHTLTSITAYTDWLWQQRIFDIGNTPAPYPHHIYGDFDNATTQWSHEMRLASPTEGRFDYVAGLYYYYMRNKGYFHQLVQTTAVNASAQEGHNRVDTLNYAAFGEANFHLTDSVTLIAGTRWTDETKELWIKADPVPTLPGVLVQGQNINARIGTSTSRASSANWSWRLGGRWEPSPERMFYATASHGHKGPGFNSLVNTNIQIVKPELATTFEVGTKSTLLNRRLQMNLALYHSMFKDYQADGVQSVVVPATGEVINLVMLSNAGRVRTQGVELEMQALPTDSLTLSFVGAFTDAVYKEFLRFPCYVGQQASQGCVGAVNQQTGGGGFQTLTGQQLNNTPRLSGTIGATYELALGSLPFKGLVHADYSWRDDVQWSRDNNPSMIEPAYGLLGASLELRNEQDRYSFTAYGKNLTNKYHFSGNGGAWLPMLTTATGSLGPDYKRIWGLSFDYQF